MPQYSHSRLSTYENCPRKFAYRYVDKIQVESEGVEAFVGKRVHEILERLYHHLARYERPPSLRQVLDRYARDWSARWHEHVVIVRGELEPEDYQARGARCLENYYRAHYPFSEGQNVGIEERLHLHLDAERKYSLVGVVDRIVRTAPGRYEIHDYKTASRLPSQPQLDRERQLALYQIGLQQTYADVEEVELVWHYLIHNRTLRSQRTPEQLEALREQTIVLIDSIEASAEYPTRTGPLCSWCEYRHICPAIGSNPARTESEPLPELERAPHAGAEPSLQGPLAEPGQQLSLLEPSPTAG